MEPSNAINDERYREEQEKLQRRHEDGSDKDIQIEIPKDPEVNPEVYRDVEPMLFRGFLTATAKINDVHVVFKSLNHHEFERVHLIAGGVDEASVGRFWSIFLAYSVFLVDGINVLADRDLHFSKTVRLFEEMPRPARDRITRPVSEINRRASNAIKLTEAYVTEVASRYRWMQLRGIDMTSTAVTGIRGTEHVGLNWAQLTWRALNQYEDLRDKHEREWENAKFVGSCFAGKGLSKVYQQDRDRRQKERESRLARKDAILRHVLLGEPLVDERRQKFGATLVAAHTADELADQLVRDLRGEKDWHDFVVAEAEMKTKTEVDAHERRIMDFARAHEQEMEGRFLVGGTDMRGITPEEMRQRQTRQKTFEAQQVAQRIVGTGDIGISTTDQDPSGAMPINVDARPRSTPFRR